MMNALPDTIRAFIALPVPEVVRTACTRLQRRLESACPPQSVRWSPSDQMHLTLRFLGNIPSQAVESLNTALAAIGRDCPPLALEAFGLGCFPHVRRPRVIWVGLRGDLEGLLRLQQAIDAAVQPWCVKTETREFHPHLTLGRVRDAAARRAAEVGQVIEGMSVESLGAWRAVEIRLMRSQLSPQGAVHTMLATHSLAAKA